MNKVVQTEPVKTRRVLAEIVSTRPYTSFSVSLFQVHFPHFDQFDRFARSLTVLHAQTDYTLE